jgi:hypothetical protein
MEEVKPWWQTSLLLLLKKTRVDQYADKKSFRRGLAELIAVKDFSLIELPVDDSIKDAFSRCVHKASDLETAALLARSKSNPSIYLRFPASDEEMSASLDNFLILCQLLGARKAYVKRVVSGSESVAAEHSGTAGGGGSYGGKGSATANVVLATSFEEKFRRLEEHGADFAGGDADIPRAKKFLDESGLWQYPAFKNIVTMVETGQVNTFHRLNEVIDFSWERTETSHLAAKVEGSLSVLNDVGNLFDFKINFEEVTKIKKALSSSYRREILITFPGYREDGGPPGASG